MGKKKSGTEAMPQWSGKKNTIGEYLGTIMERMPLLEEHGSAIVWRSI